MARNIVLLCLDSLRKDFFDRQATRLRGRADVEFAQCRSASSWSSPSHASMFTGRLPSDHGVHTHNREFDHIDRAETVLGDLPEYAAVGVSANAFASRAFGFANWFDDFREVSTGCRYPAGLDPNEFYTSRDGSGVGMYLDYLRAAVGHDHPLKSLANGILAQVNVATRDAPIPKAVDDGASVVNRELVDAATDAGEPFFAFANYGDVHIPLRPIRGFDRDLYDAPADWSTAEREFWEVIKGFEGREEYLARHRELYAATMDYLDRKLVDFVETLGAKTDLETTVVVTADHGENLGYPADEQLWGHKSSLSEGLLHVPLAVLGAPSGYDAVESRYVSHLELPDLLAGLARGKTPAIFRDRVPAEILGMSIGPDPPSDYEYWDRAQRCVYEGQRKWVWDSRGGTREFAIDHDRPCWQELSDDDADIPPWARNLFDEDVGTCKERVASTADDLDVDDPTAQRLEDLGYL